MVMSWRTRRRGTPKQKGLRFKGKTLFAPAKHQNLADIVNLKSVESATAATDTLLKNFENAKTRDKKRQIKQATVSAANRASVIAENTKLSAEKRAEFRRIHELYQNAYKAMVLPPKKISITATELISTGVGKPILVKELSKQDVENKAYQLAKTQTENNLASGKSLTQVEKQIDDTISQLQLYSVYSTKGGFGGAPDYDGCSETAKG